MTALDPAVAPRATRSRAWVRRLHVLLAAQSLLLVLASINRLTGVTDAVVLPHGSLRVVELLNLLVFPPISALLYYVLLEHLLGGLAEPARRALRLAFLAAIYLFAMSYGMHEPANYVHDRFCGGATDPLCRTVAYQDDTLSHVLFFAGFAGIAAVLMIAQAMATGPAANALGRRDRVLVLANATLIALAIVANLGFEEIGLDLIVVACVAALALTLLRLRGARPVIAYFAWAYVAGLLGTVLARLG